MKSILKPAMVVGVAAAMTLGAMTASEARERSFPAAGAGLAAGAVIAGTAAAANGAYYGPAYGAYAYEPDYTHVAAPVYSAPVYSDPGYVYEDYSAGPIYRGGYSRDNNWNEQSFERRLRGHDY